MIIDSHIHLFSNKNYPNSINGKMVADKIREAGVDKAIVLSAAFQQKDHKNAIIENDFVVAETQCFPNELIGFGAVHPLKDWSIIEADRCLRELNLKGLKLHPVNQKINFSNEAHVKKLDNLFVRTDEYESIVIIDSSAWSESEFRDFLPITARHQKTKFILAHAFLYDFRRLLVVDIFRSNMTKNIFADLSGTIVEYQDSPEKEALIWYLKRFGTNYLFLGSDYPMYTPKQTMGAFEAFSFTNDERTAINGINLEKILNL